MSKVAKQLILILAIILIGLVVYVGFLTIQNKNLVSGKSGFEQQIEEFRSREMDQILKAKKLKEQIKTAEEAKVELENQLEEFAGVSVDDLNGKIEALTKERDEWEKKMKTLKEEREDLLAKLEQKPEPQIIYKGIGGDGKEIEAGQKEFFAAQNTASNIEENEGLSENDELYWARVLKEKTGLELEVEKLRGDLSQTAIQVTELKKNNSDLQLDLTRLINEKEGIERQIKYGKDLSDSLSLELARAQNDKKFLNDRLFRMNEENMSLRGQIKQLTSTKIALEKSIVRLQDEKKNVERKLLETENVIQGRIDEIWEIKKSLDDSFGPGAKGNNQIELPPIIVSSHSMDSDEDPNVVAAPGINGNIVSVNSENNFVIIDIGQDKGINLGDSLNVYRGAEYVAGLEVIQVRKDIAAADIISKVVDIKIGDAVR